MFLVREHPRAPHGLQISEGASHVTIWTLGNSAAPFATVKELEPPFAWRVALALRNFGVNASYETHPPVVEVKLDEKRLMVCGTSNEFWCCDVREGGEVLNSHQLTILSHDERDAREVAREIAELVQAFDKGEGKPARTALEQADASLAALLAEYDPKNGPELRDELESITRNVGDALIRARSMTMALERIAEREAVGGDYSGALAMCKFIAKEALK